MDAHLATGWADDGYAALDSEEREIVPRTKVHALRVTQVSLAFQITNAYPGIDWFLSRTPLTEGEGVGWDKKWSIKILLESKRRETGEEALESSPRNAPNPCA